MKYLSIVLMLICPTLVSAETVRAKVRAKVHNVRVLPKVHARLSQAKCNNTNCKCTDCKCGPNCKCN